MTDDEHQREIAMRQSRHLAAARQLEFQGVQNPSFIEIEMGARQIELRQQAEWSAFKARAVADDR